MWEKIAHVIPGQFLVVTSTAPASNKIKTSKLFGQTYERNEGQNKLVFKFQVCVRELGEPCGGNDGVCDEKLTCTQDSDDDVGRCTGRWKLKFRIFGSKHLHPSTILLVSHSYSFFIQKIIRHLSSYREILNYPYFVAKAVISIKEILNRTH